MVADYHRVQEENLSFDSHHPITHKIADAKTLFNKANRICTDFQTEITEREHISATLKSNGYPTALIERNEQAHTRPEQTDREQPKATVVIPCI